MHADPDTGAVIDRLGEALRTSGLSQNDLARALGTSPSRFSSYMTGRVSPSAAFLMRACRIATSLSESRQHRALDPLAAAAAIKQARRTQDPDRVYALALEARDQLRELLSDRPELAESWDAEPSTGDGHWDALLAAFTEHCFEEAGRIAPYWTSKHTLDEPWTLDTPRMSEAQIKADTPDWLAKHGIFIANEDLVTI